MARVYGEMSAEEILLALCKDLINQLKNEPQGSLYIGQNHFTYPQIAEEIEKFSSLGKEYIGTHLSGIKRNLDFLHTQKLKEKNREKITSKDIIPLIKKKDYETVQIIDSFNMFKQFTGNLRQDWYSENKLEENNLFQRAKDWLSENQTGMCKFYVVIEDPDDFARNDSWGSLTLYEYAAFYSGNDLKVMGSEVQSFSN